MYTPSEEGENYRIVCEWRQRLTPSLVVGDIVRLKPEIQNKLQGYIEDVCGEVVSVSKRFARITWDDEREHSCLLSNLELADKKPYTETEHQRLSREKHDLLRRYDSAIAIMKLNQEMEEAWKKL